MRLCTLLPLSTPQKPSSFSLLTGNDKIKGHETKMNPTQIYPITQALLAAVLFGASAPVAKLLLGVIEPIPLAGFLYLGSGVGVLLFKGIQHVGRRPARGEARIRKADIPWLSGAVLAGGVGAPIVLMFSLRATPAATASLLLNFEGIATALIAALVFKEAIGGRIWWAFACITVGSILLSLELSGEWGISLGAVGVLATCGLWGIDNNFTRNVSAKDPLSIVTIKGIGAGGFSLILALILQNPLPKPLVALGAMLLGSLSYGISIALFILAMRDLGAARTSALFGTAPFIGVLLSFLLFQETPNVPFVIALPIMIAGAMLLLGEEHAHRHVHAVIEHDHRHGHDNGHHVHDHAEGEIPAHGFHSHPHTHEAIKHTHHHTPDLHHRHDH
jgi:drug/metabolite transporter (DMT)-like permease